MSEQLRRYEVFLPLRFNDGTLVPAGLIGEAILELEERYGVVSCDTQITRGIWHHEGTIFRDELTRLFVDVPDTLENRNFFQQFKERAKTTFKQVDIWMTTYPIEVIWGRSELLHEAVISTRTWLMKLENRTRDPWIVKYEYE